MKEANFAWRNSSTRMLDSSRCVSSIWKAEPSTRKKEQKNRNREREERKKGGKEQCQNKRNRRPCYPLATQILLSNDTKVRLVVVCMAFRDRKRTRMAVLSHFRLSARTNVKPGIQCKMCANSLHSSTA